MTPKTIERNREIFSAHLEGATLEQLAQQYGLLSETIYHIILREKHNRAFSPEPFYKALRLVSRERDFPNRTAMRWPRSALRPRISRKRKLRQFD